MATEVFHTENSTYEVDYNLRMIRRLRGDNEATGRFERDGVWHPFLVIEDFHGGTKLIHWIDGGVTKTSRVLQ